jgi:predicted kinase
MSELVLVSGAPGAGKTSLAIPLAARLQLPLLSKDIIKEELFDSLGRDDLSREWSRQLGAASMQLMWELAAYAPAVVLEANFRPHSDYERGRITALSDHVVEVYCACPPEIAARRYRERARTEGHHPVHVDHELPTGFESEYDEPIGVGRVIVVDTTAPVDVDAVAVEVAAMLAAIRARA